MIWPFSNGKPKLQDVVQAELARKQREAENAARTEALQKKLKDALSELGPVKKAIDRD